MGNMTSNPTGSLPRQFLRYSRIAAVLGRFLSRLAGKSILGVGADPRALASELKQALGELRGPIVKVAQLLATIPGALPSDYVAELMQLQSNVPPMGWAFVKRRMASELGADWQGSFATFEREAAAAASLGQVHKALHHDGRLLACKLQYPDMENAIEADLRGLDIALQLLEHYQGSLLMGNVRAELRDRLYEEIDYEREARHMLLYRDMLKNCPDIHVPELLPELSTQHLLTMSWLQGQSMPELAGKRTEDETNRIAVTLFRAWYVPFFTYGVIHGDPHPGNYTIRSDGSLNLLDFGCVRIFPPRLVQGVIDLYTAVSKGDEALAIRAYRAWGFQRLTKEIVSALNVWAHFIFEPLLADKRQAIGTLTGDVPGRQAAERVIAQLHKAGGVDVPREFVIMDRAAIGLGAVFLQLQAKLNWHRLFNEVIADFDLKALEERQEKTLKQHSLPLPS